MITTPIPALGKRDGTISTKTRNLKIEMTGDIFYRRTKPLIRLSGQWLERAGFKPGHRVEIIPLKTGELSLQFKELRGEPG